jgi:hypothetical protein
MVRERKAHRAASAIAAFTRKPLVGTDSIARLQYSDRMELWLQG